MYRLVSFCIALAVGAAASAQTSSTSISASRLDLPTTTKKVSTTIILSIASDLEKADNADHSSGGSIEIRPSMRISSKAALRASIAGEYDNVTGDSKVLNTQLVVARDPIALTNDDDVRLSAQLILPTEEDARLKASLRGGVGAMVGVDHRFAIAGKPSIVSYTANALKNIHEYSRDHMRNPNLSHRLRHIVNLDVNLTQKVSLSVGGYYQLGFTYENVIRETYSASQGISYAINDQYLVSVEHSTAGKMFAADGRDWNVELYDSRNSEISVSLMGTF